MAKGNLITKNTNNITAAKCPKGQTWFISMGESSKGCSKIVLILYYKISMVVYDTSGCMYQKRGNTQEACSGLPVIEEWYDSDFF